MTKDLCSHSDCDGLSAYWLGDRVIAPKDATASMAYQRGERDAAAVGFIEMSVREPESAARIIVRAARRSALMTEKRSTAGTGLRVRLS